MQEGRKDVLIEAPVADAAARVPEQLEAMDHHCPLCKRTFTWQQFKEHAPNCIRAYKARGGGN